MRLGDLHLLARLEAPADGPLTDLGGRAPGWKPVAQVYVGVEPVSGQEAEIARQADGRRRHKVTMRYRPGVSTTMRLVLPRRREAAERVLEIVEVRNEDERSDVLVLTCAEVAA